MFVIFNYEFFNSEYFIEDNLFFEDDFEGIFVDLVDVLFFGDVIVEINVFECDDCGELNGEVVVLK